MSDKTKILVSGLYFSGSGAVTDLFSEFDAVGRIPSEFDDFRRIGLVGDCLNEPGELPYPPRIYEYIQQERSYKYVSNVFGGLRSSSRNGKRAWIHELVDNAINIILSFKRKNDKKRNRNLDLKFLADLVKKLEGTESLEEKIFYAREWLKKVENIHALKSEYVVYDQPIFHGQHQDNWPEVFEPFKLVIVIRDPRDQIGELIRNGGIYLDHSTCLTHGIHEIFGSGIKGMIRYQLEALIGRYKNIENLARILPKNSINIVAFEDLVLSYEKIVPKLINFVTEQRNDITHNSPKTFFDPAVSCKNIGIHDEFLELFQGDSLLGNAVQYYRNLSDRGTN